MTDKSATVTTKPLSPGDLDAVIAIDAKTSGTSRRGYFEKRLKAATDHPEDYVFVGVFRGDDLAGFAFAKIETGAFGGSGASAALDSIAVDPDQGLQGLGQKLLAEVESVLRHKGVSTLTSQIDWAQVNMLGFMAHMGFGMAPHIVLTRPTDEIEQDLEEIEEDDEVDFSSPDGDAANALSHDRIPVRSMKDTDLAKIISMDSAHTGNDRTDYYTRKLRENLHQSGVQASLVAEQDGYPVGFIMARVDFGEFGRTSAEAVMDALGVDPGYVGQGIGKALMAKLMANLGALEVETVRTQTDWDDTGLIGYFSTTGFSPAQRIVLGKTL
ncbi:MAG: GNAT family N-acetyltransferase [Rhodobacteraceae bacterium]|nr:GNAT family N-acetyltransferase [Paracoccaceae bacterium]